MWFRRSGCSRMKKTGQIESYETLLGCHVLATIGVEESRAQEITPLLQQGSIFGGLVWHPPHDNVRYWARKIARNQGLSCKLDGKNLSDPLDLWYKSLLGKLNFAYVVQFDWVSIFALKTLINELKVIPPRMVKEGWEKKSKRIWNGG